MYKYLNTIILVVLASMIIYGESFTNELSIPVTTLFILLALISTSLFKKICEIEKKVSKLKSHKVSKKLKLEKKNSPGHEPKYYFASSGGNVVRKYKCKNGKFQQFGPFIKTTDLDSDATVVTLFNSINDVKGKCFISLIREDGVAFTTTNTQFLFPNGFIITLTKLTDSEYTGIDISDFNEDVPYTMLKRLGSDDSGRFYVKNNSELLLILKIIYNIKERMYYENES